MHVYPTEFTPRIPTKTQRYEAKGSRDRRGRIVIRGGRSGIRRRNVDAISYGISHGGSYEREN